MNWNFEKVEGGLRAFIPTPEVESFGYVTIPAPPVSVDGVPVVSLERAFHNFQAKGLTLTGHNARYIESMKCMFLGCIIGSIELEIQPYMLKDASGMFAFSMTRRVDMSWSPSLTGVKTSDFFEQSTVDTLIFPKSNLIPHGIKNHKPLSIVNELPIQGPYYLIANNKNNDPALQLHPFFRDAIKKGTAYHEWNSGDELPPPPVFFNGSAIKSHDIPSNLDQLQNNWDKTFLA